MLYLGGVTCHHQSGNKLGHEWPVCKQLGAINDEHSERYNCTTVFVAVRHGAPSQHGTTSSICYLPPRELGMQKDCTKQNQIDHHWFFIFSPDANHTHVHDIHTYI